MPGFDEEIRVAIIANADGVQAGTAEATATLNAFSSELQAAAAKAASAYAASNDAFVAAQTRAAQLLADGQAASTAQIIAAYDALNVARDANLANAMAYYTALSAVQKEALAVDDFSAASQAQAMASQVAAERISSDAAYENTAAQLENAGALEASAAAADADTAAQVVNTAAKVGNTGATIGLTEAVAGLARGNAGMAAYGLARMSASTGLLSAIMSPLGLTIIGVTAALGGLGAAAIVGSVHSQELEGALLATGDAAGLTQDQLQQMASTLAGGETTIGDARQAILDLARSGEVSGTAFQDAAQAVVDFAALTGQSTDQAAKYVETLAHATTQQLIKANEQYHFLSLAQFTNIENLRKEGKATEATDAIVQAFYSHMHSGAEQAVKDEGYLARGWDAVKRAVSGALNAVESWGAKGTYAEQIAKLQATLAQGGVATDSGFIPYSKAYIAQIDAEISALKRKEAQEQATAKASSAANAATDNAIEAKYGTGAKKSHAEHTVSMHIPRESTSYASRILAEDGRILDGLKRDADERARIASQVNSIEESAARRHAQAMLQIHIEQLRTEEAQGKITHAQELADEQKLYADEYAAQLAEYQKELALEKDKPVEVARINAEIEALQDQHAQKMAAAAEKAAQQQAAAFQKMVQPITSAFTTSINGIIQGTQTMQMAVSRMLDSILLKYIDVAIKSAVQWLASEAQKTMATMTGTATRTAVVTAAHAEEKASASLLNMATIRADAAKAAAGAYSAVVGIPYVGPVLAPIAAATAFAAVGAYEAMASFDTGAWSIPHDMPAMVHQGEMILPPPQSAELRDMLSGRSHGTGSVEHHYHIHANDAASFHDMLQRNPEALAAGMQRVMRIGALA